MRSQRHMAEVQYADANDERPPWFNPSLIPGISDDALLAWWSADRNDLITVTGAGVSSWRDIINGYDMVQATDASRPPYSATSFNGAPGVTFDGVADHLTITPAPFPTGPCEVWAVFQDNAADATNRALFSYGSNNSFTSRRMVRVATTDLLQVLSGKGTTPNVTVLSVGALTGRHVARAIFDSNTIGVQLDNEAIVSAAVAPSIEVVRARIGATPVDVASGFWNGIVRDIIVTNLMETVEANAMREYLMARRMI